MKAMLKKFFSKRVWKSLLSTVLYFALTILTLHDVFIIVAHSFNPKFMEWASPYLLDKLLEAILHTFAL